MLKFTLMVLIQQQKDLKMIVLLHVCFIQLQSDLQDTRTPKSLSHLVTISHLGSKNYPYLVVLVGNWSLD